METDFNKKDIRALFLCDRSDVACCGNELYCNSEFCSHTPDFRYALNLREFIKDPIKFLSNNCVVCITRDKIIFMEVEE